MTYNLADLEKEDKRQRQSINRLLRERYKLARELGFSSSEARILSLKPEEVARRLAKERQGKSDMK